MPPVSPAVLGLGFACVILMVLGLARAVGDYGHAGFVAYLKLLVGPALVVAAALLVTPGLYRGGAAGGILPSRVTMRRIAIGVLIVTAGLLTLSGVVGVGWLLR